LPQGNADTTKATASSLALQAEELAGVCDAERNGIRGTND
jgi:hypothetical protein